MGNVFTRVNHTEYLKLIEKCKLLENENAALKGEIKKLTAKSEKAETKVKKG